MSKITIKRWVHANICVRDMERTIPFYEMLGFRKFSDMMFEDSADVWAGLGIARESTPRRFRAVFMEIPGEDGPFLDIIQFIDPKTTGKPYPTLHNAGTCRLCFEVDDLDAVETVLRDAGVELVSPAVRYETARGVEPRGGEGIRFLCLRDPDGTFLEYIEVKHSDGYRRGGRG